jgi:hypothetical protein
MAEHFLSRRTLIGNAAIASIAIPHAVKAAPAPSTMTLISGYHFAFANAGDIAEFDPSDRQPTHGGLFVMDGHIVVTGRSEAGLGYYGTWRETDGDTWRVGPLSAEEWAEKVSGRLVALHFRRAA